MSTAIGLSVQKEGGGSGYMLADLHILNTVLVEKLHYDRKEIICTRYFNVWAQKLPPLVYIDSPLLHPHPYYWVFVGNFTAK